MPGIGARSAHDCPDCGQPMYWSEAALRDPDLLPSTTGGVQSTPPYVDAYRCANGHTSVQCPVCGSYDTAAWTDGERPADYHVICGSCGNDSITGR